MSANSSSSWVALLGIAFIVLKLTGHIAWSWWWVLAPFWVPLVLVGVVLTVFGAVCMVAWWKAR